MNDFSASLSDLKGQGFPSQDLLYSRKGIQKIDEAFATYLGEADFSLLERMKKIRLSKMNFEDGDLIDLSYYVDGFLKELFDLHKESEAWKKKIKKLEPILAAKTSFVQRYVLRASDLEELQTKIQGQDGLSLEKSLSGYLGTTHFDADIFAQKVLQWLLDKNAYKDHLAAAKSYTVWCLFTWEGQNKTSKEPLFQVAFPKNFDQLLKNVSQDALGTYRASKTSPLKTGFSYRGKFTTLEESLVQVNYCLLCHPQKKDSCSKGMLSSEGSWHQNPLGRPLEGCPLKQKISQMNQVASQGFFIGALAIITLDNPLVALTGDGICQDCKEACIFQKQEGVDVPKIETQILRQVLALPFGFEIYSLLTRWQPLSGFRFIPAPEKSAKVLVVGMGPAGCMLSHLLVNEGYTVVGIDGLKAEPLPKKWIGHEGEKLELIKDSQELFQYSQEREARGFGGVLDYGLTARWDKRFLIVARLLLERRLGLFTFLSGVRFGGAFNEQKAKELGFDHVALCLGAGAPKRLSVKNDLAKGVWLASDFLMALHSTGESEDSLLVRPLVQLPCVVVGGGLTAVDTATEVIHTYIAQVRTFLRRYEALVRTKAEKTLRSRWTLKDCEIADRILAHGRSLRAEETLAVQEGRAPNLQALIQEWGGVKMVYRKSISDSPSYKINVEELQKALESGVQFLERCTLLQIDTHMDNSVEGVVLLKAGLQGQQEAYHEKVPARMVVVAYGTQPNTVLMREKESLYSLEDIKAIKEVSDFILPPKISKLSVSILGDLHPSYSGSVVKAMASAKNAFLSICASMKERDLLSERSSEGFLIFIKEFFQAVVVDVKRLQPDVVELTLKAPFAAESFQPGQFFRLTNQQPLGLEDQQMISLKAPEKLDMEGIALTGCQVDLAAGTVSLVVLEEGVSTSLVKQLKVETAVNLMGPTGQPSLIPSNENVLLIGGGLGIASLLSIAHAMKVNGCRVYFIAGFKNADRCFKKEIIEAASHCVVWCFEEGPKNFVPLKKDVMIEGTLLEGLKWLMRVPQGKEFLKDLGTLLVIGSAPMMEATQHFLKEELLPWLPKACRKTASVNAPMACMLKEICGKCIQRHTHPDTGQESYIFTCTQQDQNLETIDFSFLKHRLAQNHLIEDLTFQWRQFQESQTRKA